MSCAALALDVDVTITHADQQIVQSLIKDARKFGADIFVNTARSQRWCANLEMTGETLAHGIEPEKHHCLLPNMHVPSSKLENMRRIAHNAGVDDASCAALLDDMDYNVAAVEHGGFIGIYTPEGIAKEHAERAMTMVKRCCKESES